MNLLYLSLYLPHPHPTLPIYLVPKCLGAKSSRGIYKFGAETSRAESSRCRNDLGAETCVNHLRMVESRGKQEYQIPPLSVSLSECIYGRAEIIFLSQDNYVPHRREGRPTIFCADPVNVRITSHFQNRGARWLSGRVSDSGARGLGFETYRRRVVSLSKTLYSPKVLVNYPGSDGSVPTWLKNCWLGR